MKKFMTVLVASTVLVSTFALADDLSALTDDELLALRQEVLEEMERRGLSAEPKTASDLAEITLYYQPEGGNYYHLDQNCPVVNPRYLPLTVSMTKEELEQLSQRIKEYQKKNH